jgi:inner membrane protein
MPARSMGMKLLLVCGLALLMTIPALFVFALLTDRTHRAEQVAVEVGGLMGGPQTFLGPVVAVPYVLPPGPPAPGGQPSAPTSGTQVYFPETGTLSAKLKAETRKRSLFVVPVWRGDLSFEGVFDLTGAESRAPREAVLDWSRAELLMGATNPRGVKSEIALTVNGQRLPVVPAANLAPIDTTRDGASGSPSASLDFFGAKTPLIAPGAKLTVTSASTFSGAQRIAFLPFAKSTRAHIASDWADPSFDGALPPTSRTVDSGGFAADWLVPLIARGVSDEGADTISRLGQAAFGVSFVEAANPYQAVARSLKYALLFVGLVFLAFFIFETLTHQRVHPAQYVLIGLAQIIFYLLLLSIAERTGFDVAFVIAAIATVSLISAYAGWVFESARRGLQALVCFGLLYGLIYILMRLEDWALLVGAVASFAAIAAVMFLTRKIDWYGGALPPVALVPVSASKDPA